METSRPWIFIRCCKWRPQKIRNLKVGKDLEAEIEEKRNQESFTGHCIRIKGIQPFRLNLNDYFYLILKHMKIGVIKEWVKPGQAMSFGEIKLKPMQIAILKCNRSQDVLVNLPTGFGKSLLFQYPASLLNDKCIVVFVPLKALLWDCLKEAELHNLTAVQCDSAFIRKYQSHGFLPQLLFLTPERLFQNQAVMSFIYCLNDDKKIELFVVDEAHCISEWGSDFRPDYSRLGEIRSLFPGIRILGMSATIPPEALKDLIAKLQITGCYYFQSSSNRPNLIYEVINTEKSKISGSIIDYVKQKQLKQESGIVYCQTIKNAEEVFKELNKYEFSCCLFHSKLPQRKREENFVRFMNGEIKCIVATICFGMGVNKKNIRYVINVGISLSAQNYYQQSGRAGRDGEISFCLLLTYSSDVAPLTFLINQSTKKKILVRRKLYKLQQLKVYTKAHDCRKRTLFKLLGEDFSIEDCKKTCDFCINGMAKDTVFESVDYTQKGYHIIEEMQKFKETLTKLQLIGFLKGRDVIKNKITKEKLHNIYQYLKDEKNQYVEKLVEEMIARGLLIPYSQKLKGKYIRYVEYLKVCTKSEFNRQRQQKLLIKVSVNARHDEISKINKEHIPNPYVHKRFQKYVIKKSKSLDAPQFELQFEKEQPNKIEKRNDEVDEDMKQIKMVEMGPDYDKFFDQLFPEHAELSKEDISYDQIEEGQDIDIIMQLQSVQTSKDDIQQELEDPYLSIGQFKMQSSSIPQQKYQRKESLEIKQGKQRKESNKQEKPQKIEKTKQNKSSQEDSCDSLFQLIKRKKQQLKEKRETQHKKEVIKRKKQAEKIYFL